MRIQPKKFIHEDFNKVIRLASVTDAEALSKVRLQIDGETENSDREKGEGHLNREDFQQM